MQLRITLLALLSTSAMANNLSVTCLGPKDASHAMIYLHGMDSIQPSQQELSNRGILERIAKSLNIRIAAPRAIATCPSNEKSICWGWKFNEHELSEVLPAILESRKNCFGASIPFGILGFSNGGYLITHWYRRSLYPLMPEKPAYLIASGSDLGVVPSTTKSLINTPPLTLLIGNKDLHNCDPDEGFFNQLKQVGASVDRIEFKGAHELNWDSLNQAIGKYLNLQVPSQFLNTKTKK